MSCHNLFKGLFAGVGCDEGDVVWRMVVAGGDFDREGELDEGVDCRDDVPAVWDREGTRLLLERDGGVRVGKSRFACLL